MRDGLIPETLAITNLDNYREGDKLNIEVDQQPRDTRAMNIPTNGDQEIHQAQ